VANFGALYGLRPKEQKEMAQISNSKNLKILQSLETKAARGKFFAGGRATTQRISQVQDRKIVHKWVGKVRGVVVQVGDQAIFDTEQEALENAQQYLELCRKEQR
jgi:hypothetical protein